MTLLVKVTIGLVAGYILLSFGLYFGQRLLMYHPNTARVDPVELGLNNVTERILKTGDGNRLIAWQAKAMPGKPTILYFHGNAGNLADRAERLSKLMAQGYGFFILSYRGFGGSSGQPSENAIFADAELAYTTITNEGIAASDIVLFGESLGTAVATRLAVRHRGVAGLILDAPFTSMADAAAYHYPWVWVRPFVTDRYDTRSIIRAVTCPILILHGEQDQVVPVSMGRKLARIVGERAQLVTYSEGQHMNLDSFGAIDAVTKFINGLRGSTNDQAVQ